MPTTPRHHATTPEVDADVVAVAIECADGWLHVADPAAPTTAASLPQTVARTGETAFEAAVRCAAEQLGIDVLPSHSDGLTPVGDGSHGVHTVIAHPATPTALARATRPRKGVVRLPERHVSSSPVETSRPSRTT